MTESHNDRPRQLRRDATDAERRLWSALRDRRLRGYRFRRQHPIGNFIVDFACTGHRLIMSQFAPNRSFVWSSLQARVEVCDRSRI